MTGASPRRTSRGRLFRKYLTLILSLVTIALLASGAITVYFSYQENKSALASLQHEKALAAASRIEQYIQRIEQQLAYAALPQLDASDVELRRIEFLKLLRQAPEVTDVAQIDATGHEQIAVSRLGMDSVSSDKDRSQEPAFQNAKRGQSWFGPVYFRKETEPYMTIAIRSGGDKGPVTVADVNLKFIWDVVSRIKIGDKGKAYVVDGNGFLIADPDIGLVLRKTNLSNLAHVKAASAKQNPSELAMLSTDIAGTSVLTSAAPIETLNWKVFVEQPVAEVYEKLNASILRTGLLLLAGLVISSIGAMALARGMVRPIRTLDEGARRIGEGDLDQKIEVRTGDELEALADRFNRMSAQLRESYAGLERKVEERTSELKNSLEQQTAISEILRVISASPTDVQPVLDAVAERAAYLCDSPYARVLLVDDDHLRPAAIYSREDPRSAHSVQPTQPVQPTALKRSSINGRAVLDRETIHIADVLPLFDSEYPDARQNAVPAGIRAALAVPLVREDIAYGSIFIFRRQPGLFSPDQVALLQTFARQAAIAIDNVRLFNETREALDQQTAISEILRVISSSPGDVRPMLNAVAERALNLCSAAQSGIFLVEGDALRFAAGFGSMSALEEGELMPLTRGSASGRAVLDRTVIHLEDLAAAPEDEFPLGRELQRRIGSHAILSVPLMREDRAIGAITLWRMEARAFTDKQIALVKTFADQGAIAIENVRLFNETKEALEQQTAIAEILRVISSSPTDVLPVLDAIAERAARLCDASAASMYLTEGDMLRHLASKGPSPDPVGHVDALPINRDSISGRALLEHKTIQVDDMLAEGAEYPLSFEIAQRYGHRTVVVVPLFREGKPFGTILLRRKELRPFSDREIALLKTFGDQAAIALENVRLFNETKEALDQQRASGEVLTAISSSIADTKPVFDAITQSCQRLFAGHLVGLMLVRDDGMLDIGAYKGPGAELWKKYYPRPLARDTATGTAILDRKVVAYADVDTRDTPAIAHELSGPSGFQSLAAAPMIFEGRGIGALWVARSFKGSFNDKQLALLKTFADQAVIAIQNARLFNETKEALEQQQASGQVLAAISSSIADTKPVFDKILASCERLFAGKVIAINLLGDDGRVHRAAYHGPDEDKLTQALSGVGERETGTWTAITRRAVLHYPDIAKDDEVPSGIRIGSAAVGVKAGIVAPMIWENKGIGAIMVGRDYTGPFSEKEIALLKTFADQAVIAIQNARLFREIQEKSLQLETANKHKSEFLANMSHELRTPLNAIIGFSEVLLERLFGDLNEKQDDYLKDIHSSGKHLLSLINDILDLSKIEAGRMELETSTFELASALSNAMTLVRERAQRHGILLGQQVDAKLGEIVADERKFKQILVNLLSNAVKFTPDGGRVDVTARREDSNAVIAVHDTGIGIAAEDQAAVFEEFRQVGRDYTKKQEGTGLGLALTRKFIELHGGRIWLESEPGKGSTFTFSIPIRQ
jgi:signal transduction histidine kinase/HAMP domain-containing protein